MDLQGKGMARSNENCKDEEAAVNKPKTGDLDNTRKRELKYFYANVRSIIDIEKRMELELFVYKEEPDIIGLTETWAKEEIADSELALDGYIMFRKDRENQKARGYGGVLLYVKSSITAVQRKDIWSDKFKEYVWCEIQSGKARVLIGVCYRPPSAKDEVDDGLWEIIEKASKETMVMMGDFNYHINREEMEGERKEDRKFIDMVNDTFLQQHVEETTREGSKYILDWILTTDETLVNKVKVGEIFNRSDHQIIRWTLSVGEPMMEESLHRKFNYFKADYDLVRLKMRGKDLERRTKDVSVHESWNLLKKSLNKVIEETIPRAVGMVKKRPWVTRKVQKKRRAKQRAW